MILFIILTRYLYVYVYYDNYKQILIVLFFYFFLISDLAVTIGREVDFFSNNGTMTGRLKNREAVALYSITYDQDSHILFLSDNNNKHVSIFTKNLHSKELKMDPLLNGKKIGKNI